jgi:phosphate-selective porin OprO/OprP
VKTNIITAFGVLGALVASPAIAQSAADNDVGIALLKQQLRLLEQKLNRLEKQGAANAKAEAKAAVANANAAIPAKAAIPPSGTATPSEAVVSMPHNRPNNRRPTELHIADQSGALRWRRLRLSPQHSRNRASATLVIGHDLRARGP